MATRDPPSLASLCYQIAYFILPRYAFHDRAKLVAMWTETPTTCGPFFYLMACKVSEIEPNHQDLVGFKTHRGQLNPEVEYYALEYPKPPPFELKSLDFDELDRQPPVLAPYFSAIVCHLRTNDCRYFALGQAPIGGSTTLRRVTADGANWNLGSGPDPQIDQFLNCVRERGLGE